MVDLYSDIDVNLILRIERALALSDPMGLIRMGAPIDEYSSEAYSASAALVPNFNETQFVQSVKNALTESFGKVAATFDDRKIYQLLNFFYDSRNPMLQFISGSVYRANAFETISFDGTLIRGGSIMTLIDRFAHSSGESILLFHMEDRVVHYQMSDLAEMRLRWLFDEVQ